MFSNHFFQISLILLKRFWPTLLTMPLMLSRAGLRELDFCSYLLKKASLEMEVELENLLRFCLSVTLLSVKLSTR